MGWFEGVLVGLSVGCRVGTLVSGSEGVGVGSTVGTGVGTSVEGTKVGKTCNGMHVKEESSTTVVGKEPYAREQGRLDSRSESWWPGRLLLPVNNHSTCPDCVLNL